jgi:hypothetical protein
MATSEETALLWKTRETSSWQSFEGNHTFVGIVKSFDPNGFLKLEVLQSDIDILASGKKPDNG